MASFCTKAALLKGFLDGERAYTGPLWVVLEATRRCNTFCAGCYGRSELDQPGAFPEGRRDIPFDVIDRICRELPPMGTREIFFAGLGEPLLHPKIFDILAALRQAGLRTQLFTNGLLLTEAFAEAVVASGPDDLRVTVWATDSRQYSELHPGTNPALLGKGIEGLRRVVRLRNAAGRRTPRVHMQAPLNRANFHDIDTRVRAAVEAGCDSLCFGYYRHFGRQFEHLCLAPDDVPKLEPALERARAELRRAGIGENIDEYRSLLSTGPDFWRRMPCYSGWLEANILSDGRVQVCGHCDVIAGDLTSQSFAEIWNGPGFREFRRLGSRPGGAAAYGPACECADCCQMKDNLRVHRTFRWLAPLRHVRRPWGTAI